MQSEMYGTSTGDHDRGKCRTLSWLITVIAYVFAEHRECDGLLMRLFFIFFLLMGMSIFLYCTQRASSYLGLLYVRKETVFSRLCSL